MKQILQNLGTGETLLADVPAPGPRKGHLLIETTRTLVSLGTEKMLVDFGRAGWIAKARKQPEKVKQVLQKVRTEGLFPTIEAVKSKLDQPLALGYCQVGRVVDAGGPGAHGFAVGDRVVSNGPHAEVVSVPVNLCARIPDGVSDESAAFTVVASIGLQGIRLLAPTLGERIVVTGLGLIGLLAVQMLRAQGCQVLGLDFDGRKCALARQFGAETVDLSTGADPVAAAEAFAKGQGVDGVLITASTQSSEPVSQAARMCRKRGRIVLVGVTGLELNRSEFYQKELTFQVSCSYGPGRYDAAYEDQGLDYPIGFVRWTEQRNFEAVLDLMASGALRTDALVTHRFAIGDALAAYETVASGKAMGIVLEYGDAAAAPAKLARSVEVAKGQALASVPMLNVIGAGNFTTRTLLPALKGKAVTLGTIVSAGGASSAHAARKFGFAKASTDTAAALADPAADAVVITTRHDAHARQVLAALEAGRNVFVEKPLCLNLEELDAIAAAARVSKGMLMVGFNRRFAPLTQQLRQQLKAATGPKSFVITVNAGAIPADHWTQDPAVGGGRIVGEACHFVDLMRHLADSPIVSARADYMGGAAGRCRDTACLHLAFADGSVGTVHYFANGDKGFPKERIEVFASGRILQLDNFRTLKGWGCKGFSKAGGGLFAALDKGHANGIGAFLDAVAKGGPSPIPLDEILEVSRIAIELASQGK